MNTKKNNTENTCVERDITNTPNPNEDKSKVYEEGAHIYKCFLRLPAEYRHKTVRLQIRIDDSYGTWRLKEELFEAFRLPVGGALFLNDVFVKHVDFSDIDEESHHIDMFVVGDAAKWFLENNITKGNVVEGNFLLEWTNVKNVAGKSPIAASVSDAHVAMLLLSDPDIQLISAKDNEATIENGAGLLKAGAKLAELFASMGNLSD